MENTFKTILEDDMGKLLASLGLQASRTLKCSHCSRDIKKVEIFGVYPFAGEVKIACNLPECIQKTLTENNQ